MWCPLLCKGVWESNKVLVSSLHFPAGAGRGEMNLGPWAGSPPQSTYLYKRWNRVSVSAHSAGAYTATLLVMVNVTKGGGRAPPTLTRPGLFYPHDCMYARKQTLLLCVLCGPHCAPPTRVPPILPRPHYIKTSGAHDQPKVSNVRCTVHCTIYGLIFLTWKDFNGDL